MQKDFDKIKQQFYGSPLLNANLALIEKKIAEIDAAIDEKIFQIYNLSEEDIAFIKDKTVPVTKAT